MFSGFSLSTTKLMRGKATSIKSRGLVAAILIAISGSAAANPLQSSISTQEKTERAEIASQKKIDRVADETDTLLNQYRQAVREAESLRLYNDHVEKLITSQQSEIDSIGQQLLEIDVTSKEIVPLMLRMVDMLKQFVAIDTPFLADERNTRVANLEKLMLRADVSVSEKFRRVIEAYQVEMEYGRTIEAYRGKLNTEGNDLTVDFLRIGRVGFYYSTLDGDQVGVWNAKNKNWETLPGKYRSGIREGLRIARKQAAPNLLKLPVSAPELVQ